MAAERLRRIELFADDLYKYLLPRRINVKDTRPSLRTAKEEISDFHPHVGMSVLFECHRSQQEFMNYFANRITSITENVESYLRFCASYSMDLYLKNKDNAFKAFIVLASMILELGIFCHHRGFKYFKYYSGMCFSSIFHHILEEAFFENGGWDSLKQYASEDAKAYTEGKYEVFVNEYRTEYRNDWLRLFDLWVMLIDTENLLKHKEVSPSEVVFTPEGENKVFEEYYETNYEITQADYLKNISESNVTSDNNFTEEKPESFDREKGKDLEVKDNMYISEVQKDPGMFQREQPEGMTDVALAEEADMVLKSSSAKTLQNNLLLDFKDKIACNKDSSFEQLSVILKSDSNVDLLMNDSSFRHVMKETVQNPDKRMQNNDILELATLVLSGNETMAAYCVYAIRHINESMDRSNSSVLTSTYCEGHTLDNTAVNKTMHSKSSVEKVSSSTKSSHLGAIPKKLNTTTTPTDTYEKLIQDFKRVISSISNSAGSEITTMFESIYVANILSGSPVFRNIMKLTVDNPEHRWRNEWILSVAKRVVVAFSKTLKTLNTVKQESFSDENKIADLSPKQVPTKSEVFEVDKVVLTSSSQKTKDSDPIFWTSNTRNAEEISPMGYQIGREIVSEKQNIDLKTEQELEKVPEFIPDSHSRIESLTHTADMLQKDGQNKSPSKSDSSIFSSPDNKNENSQSKKLGDHQYVAKSEAEKNIDLLAAVFKQFTPAVVSVSVSSDLDPQHKIISSESSCLVSSKRLLTCAFDPNASEESTVLRNRIEKFNDFYGCVLEHIRRQSMDNPLTELPNQSSAPETEEIEDIPPEGVNDTTESSPNVSDKPKTKSQIRRERRKRKLNEKINNSHDTKSVTSNIATDKETGEYYVAKTIQSESGEEIESTTNKEVEKCVAKIIQDESIAEIDNATIENIEHVSVIVSHEVIKSSDDFEGKTNEIEFSKETTKISRGLNINENEINMPLNVSGELVESCELSSPESSIAITAKLSMEYLIESPVFYERNHTWLTEIYSSEITSNSAVLKSAKIPHSAIPSDNVIPVTPTRKSTESVKEHSCSDSNSPEAKNRLFSALEDFYDLEEKALTNTPEHPQNDSSDTKVPSQESEISQSSPEKKIYKATLVMKETSDMDLHNILADRPTINTDNNQSYASELSGVCKTETKFEKILSTETSFSKENEQEKLPIKNQNTSRANVERDHNIPERLEKYAGMLINKMNTELQKEIVQSGEITEESKSLSGNNSLSLIATNFSENVTHQISHPELIQFSEQFLQTSTKLTVYFLYLEYEKFLKEQKMKLLKMNQSQNTAIHEKPGSISLKDNDEEEFAPPRYEGNKSIETADTLPSSTNEISQEKNILKFQFELKSRKHVQIITASDSLPFSIKQKSETVYRSSACHKSETSIKDEEGKSSLENQKVSDSLSTTFAMKITTDSDHTEQKYDSSALPLIEYKNSQPQIEHKSISFRSHSLVSPETCYSQENVQLQKTESDSIVVSKVSDTRYKFPENQQTSEKCNFSRDDTASSPKDDIPSDMEEKMALSVSISELCAVKSSDIKYSEKAESSNDDDSLKHNISDDGEENIMRYQTTNELSDTESLLVKNLEKVLSLSQEVEKQEHTKQRCPYKEIPSEVLNAETNTEDKDKSPVDNQKDSCSISGNLSLTRTTDSGHTVQKYLSDSLSQVECKSCDPQTGVKSLFQSSSLVLPEIADSNSQLSVQLQNTNSYSKIIKEVSDLRYNDPKNQICELSSDDTRYLPKDNILSEMEDKMARHESVCELSAVKSSDIKYSEKAESSNDDNEELLKHNILKDGKENIIRYQTISESSDTEPHSIKNLEKAAFHSQEVKEQKHGKQHCPRKEIPSEDFGTETNIDDKNDESSIENKKDSDLINITCYLTSTTDSDHAEQKNISASLPQIEYKNRQPQIEYKSIPFKSDSLVLSETTYTYSQENAQLQKTENDSIVVSEVSDTRYNIPKNQPTSQKSELSNAGTIDYPEDHISSNMEKKMAKYESINDLYVIETSDLSYSEKTDLSEDDDRELQTSVCLKYENNNEERECKSSVDIHMISDSICTIHYLTKTIDSDCTVQKHLSDSLSQIEYKQIEDNSLSSQPHSLVLPETSYSNIQEHVLSQKTKANLMIASDTSYNFPENQQTSQICQMSGDYTKNSPKVNISSDMEEKMPRHEPIIKLSAVESSDITYSEKAQLSEDDNGELQSLICLKSEANIKDRECNLSVENQTASGFICKNTLSLTSKTFSGDTDQKYLSDPLSHIEYKSCQPQTEDKFLPFQSNSLVLPVTAYSDIQENVQLQEVKTELKVSEAQYKFPESQQTSQKCQLSANISRDIEEKLAGHDSVSNLSAVESPDITYSEQPESFKDDNGKVAIHNMSSGEEKKTISGLLDAEAFSITDLEKAVSHSQEIEEKEHTEQQCPPKDIHSDVINVNENYQIEDISVPSYSCSLVLSETTYSGSQECAQLQKTKSGLIVVSDAGYNFPKNQQASQKSKLSFDDSKDSPNDNISSDKGQMTRFQSISDLSAIEYSDITYSGKAESSKDDNRELSKHTSSGVKEKNVRCQSVSELLDTEYKEKAASHSQEFEKEHMKQQCSSKDIPSDVLNAYENALKSINMDPSSEVSTLILHEILKNDPAFLEVLKQKIELEKRINSQLIQYRDLFDKKSKNK